MPANLGCPITPSWTVNDPNDRRFIANKPTNLTDFFNDLGLAALAYTGSYNSVTGAPNLSNVATTGSYEDLNNTPNLQPVATAGSYQSLTGVPTALSQFENDLGLAAVALTGAYEALYNAPTAVSQFINDKLFTPVGSNVSSFVNDSNYTPVGSNVSSFVNNTNYTVVGSKVSQFINDLLFTTVGSKISQFVNDIGYATVSAGTAQFANNSNYAVIGQNVSEFANNAGYINASQVPATVPTYGVYQSPNNGGESASGGLSIVQTNKSLALFSNGLASTGTSMTVYHELPVANSNQTYMGMAQAFSVASGVDCGILTTIYYTNGVIFKVNCQQQNADANGETHGADDMLISWEMSLVNLSYSNANLVPTATNTS